MADTPSSLVSDHLGAFGIQADEKAAQHIENLSGDRVVIGDDPSGLPFQVHMVKASSLAEIKSWIGNANDAVKTHGIEVASPMNLAAVDPSQADIDTLVHAARLYVYGDSSAVSGFVPEIESKLGPFEVMVLGASTIKIKPGQTLVFDGSTPKVVTADELIFEGAGSNIESFVNLSMKIGKVIVN